MEVGEKRRHLRYGISTEIEIQYEEKSIIAEAIEISVDGLGILTSSSIPPEKPVRAVLKMPEEIILYCRSVWAVRTPTSGRNEYRTGFAVEGISRKGTIQRDPIMIDRIVQEIVSEFG